jgi:hypothetical protein
VIILINGRIHDGILTVESKSIVLELTIYESAGQYNLALLKFEHKLEKMFGMEKKIQLLNDEIDKIYVENKRELEKYVIAYIFHKVKYHFSRSKLESLIKQVNHIILLLRI